MPSINQLVNYNLANSVDSRGGDINQRNLWFYGNRGSYSSGSAIWYDLSGNGHNALVSGSTLVPTGSLGFVFNGLDNWLEWPAGGFTTGSCVDSGFTIQITMQPDPADVLTSPYNTTVLFDNQIGYLGGQGFSAMYLNDGQSGGGSPGPTQGFQWNTLGQNNYRALYVYGNDEFISGSKNVAWSFEPQPTSTPLSGSMQWNYYIPEYQPEPYTYGNNVNFDNAITPTKQFGKKIYAATPLYNTQSFPYFYFKGIVRDILIYNRALSQEEIYKNYLALNAINATY